MISQAIAFLRQQLESQFAGLDGDTEFRPTVTMRSLVDQEGRSTPGGEKGVSLTVVNIEEEIAARRPYAQRETQAGIEIGPAALNLNLSVLVTADFKPDSEHKDSENVSKNYGNALLGLTKAVEFFQSHPCFTPENSPELPDGIGKLMVHPVNLSVQEQQNLWAYIGAKYMPSVLYKVSMITLASDKPTRSEMPVSEIDLVLNPL